MNIGDKVRDTVSGFSGTITGETTWQGGRQTFYVQPTVDAKGNYREGRWIDAPLLELWEPSDYVTITGFTQGN